MSKVCFSTVGLIFYFLFSKLITNWEGSVALWWSRKQKTPLNFASDFWIRTVDYTEPLQAKRFLRAHAHKYGLSIRASCSLLSIDAFYISRWSKARTDTAIALADLSLRGKWADTFSLDQNLAKWSTIALYNMSSIQTQMIIYSVAVCSGSSYWHTKYLEFLLT